MQKKKDDSDWWGGERYSIVVLLIESLCHIFDPSKACPDREENSVDWSQNSPEVYAEVPKIGFLKEASFESANNLAADPNLQHPFNQVPAGPLYNTATKCFHIHRLRGKRCSYASSLDFHAHSSLPAVNKRATRRRHAFDLSILPVTTSRVRIAAAKGIEI